VEIRRGQVIIHPPGHPFMLITYTIVGVVVAFLASSAIASATASLGLAGLAAGYIISLLIMMSPPLSFVNIVLGFIGTGYYEQVLEVEYVSFAGIPIPVPRISLVEKKTVLAINLGGGVIPITVSLLIIILLAGEGRVEALWALLASVVVTSLVTYAFSRTIPGVGIAVPALIPPLASAITVAVIAGSGPVAALAAYAGGTLGALIGADVLRLLHDLDKLSSPMVSIGGAGVFDGVFLAGVIALLLTY